MEEIQEIEAPPPVLQVCFDSTHGWTVVAQKTDLIFGKDAPDEIRQEFQDQTGHEMPDDFPLGHVIIKGKRFSSQDELLAWMTEVVPTMWGWFVGLDTDVPADTGLES